MHVAQEAEVPTTDIVLVGGGHAHALVLKMWAMEPLARARLTLLTPGPSTPYTGMLPGHIAGHYPRDAIEIDLVQLARRAGARIVLERACGIDRSSREVICDSGRRIGYDLLSLDIGVNAPLVRVDASTHSVRPLDGFASAFADLCATNRTGDAVQMAVVGGGLGGIELALAMQHAVVARGAITKVTLIDRGGLAKGEPPGIAARLRKVLGQRNIALLENTEVLETRPGGIVTTQGEIRSDFTAFASGAAPHDWLPGTGLALERGFISVGETLASLTDPDIFAAGDCAAFTPAPLQKAGVFAVRQAPVLIDNLRARVLGRTLRPYRPQRRFLKLVSLGDQNAMAIRGGLALAGRWAWAWKDRIDRRFMEQFAPPTFSPETPMFCGGCGSKVGRGLLAPHFSDQFGDDAALLSDGRVITTDHLRACTEDVGLMAEIATIHALGDIWAMGARPEQALVHLTLPRADDTLVARDLDVIMATIRRVLDRHGARVIGGHTTHGDELTIGLTLTGQAHGPLIRNAGAQVGDLLILTKRLGSGTLLAAEARGLADGRQIAALWQGMIAPQDIAAEVLALAHAMTDVTGFGLAGHLSAMAQASGLGAQIRLAALPLYDGAEDWAARGLRSSLFNRNVQDFPLVGPQSPRTDLLFDPQTCGGLLAAVAQDQAQDLLDRLAQRGVAASVIGQITKTPGLVAK